MHEVDEDIKAAIIHDIWVMEEKASNGRKWVWFRPPKLPMRAPVKNKNGII